MMSLDQKSDIKRLMAVFFLFFAHALFCWQQYKTDVQKFAFWLPIDTEGAAAATGRNHGAASATAAAASKGKKGKSRNYYNYLVQVRKHPDFQSLLALAQA